MRLLLITTNDSHSRCGSYARLTRAVSAVRATRAATPTLWCDAGDWFSGSPYAAVMPTTAAAEAPELDMFHENGAVVTLGNHEFDATVEGLVVGLEKAARRGFKRVVQTDLVLDVDDVVAVGDADADAEVHKKRGVLERFAELKRQGVVNESVLVPMPELGDNASVGFVGLMGPQARRGCLATTHGTGVSFLAWEAAIEKAAHAVAELRRNGAVLVVALVHGGKPECQEVLRETRCDFVAAGHTHERFPATDEEPISQAGAYAESFGAHLLSLSDLVDDAFVVESEVLDVDEVLSTLGSEVPEAGGKEEEEEAHHPTFHTHVKRLYAEQAGVDLTWEFPESSLPPLARAPITRGNARDPFATWLCSVVRDELNASVLPPEFRVHAFFMPQEMIRRDFAPSLASSTGGEKPLRAVDIIECLDVGRSDPERMGFHLVVLEVRAWQLWTLDKLFAAATVVVTPDATAAFSDDAFSPSPLSLVRVATTDFTARNLAAVPDFVFPSRSGRVHVVPSVSLGALLVKALQRGASSSSTPSGST